MACVVSPFAVRRSFAAIAMLAAVHCTAIEQPEPTTSTVATRVVFSPSSTVVWSFPETGSSPGGHPDYRNFQTFFHFVNTNGVPVRVAARFQDDAGVVVTATIDVPANRRLSRELVQLTGRTGFYAAEFHSQTPGREIQVSSTMLNDGFDGPFWSASAAVNGSTEARTTWLFGEGGAYAWLDAARPVFDNWFMVYNPTGAPTTVSGTAHADDVDPRRVLSLPARTIPPRSRVVLAPFPSFAEGDEAQVRSARITCEPQPCVAQQVMRQRRAIGTRQTNSQSALGSVAARRWSFVGIPTSASWNPRLYFYNSSLDSTSTVTLTYRDGNGSNLGVRQFGIGSRLRHTYDIRQDLIGATNPPGLHPALNQDGNISLSVIATTDIVVTKILYWPADGSQWSEGASTTGHRQGGPYVIFPGGTVGGGWSNYVQYMNVGATAVNVRATFYLESGEPIDHDLGVIPVGGMRQIDASAFGLNGNFATKLEAPGGQIIAEQSTYLHFTGGPQLWHTGDAVEGIVYNADPAVSPTSFPVQP